MKNIAIFFGGCSPEYSVSLESVGAVIRNLDSRKYRPILIGISKEGDFYYYRGEVEKIEQDCWQNSKDCIPAALSPNPKDRGLLLLEKEGTRVLPVDAAFPVMHGKYGEDGAIQGMIEMAQIPLVGCGVLSSALCMDKLCAHRLAKEAGVRVPRSIAVGPEYERETVLEFGRSLGYPVFVKPVRAGSSYGITKVQKEEDLLYAVEFAFQYDSQVVVEEAIQGFEVGCAVLGRDVLTVGAVDEIELAEGFFDFTEKYTLITSKIHVPARISQDQEKRIRETAKLLYRTLDCDVFARVDMFLTDKGDIVFNEINTIPGFTEHSRYPKMMEAVGISFSELLDRMIRLAVKE